MSEMVDRVVQAMKDTGCDCASWADEPLQEVARAAIAAMRQPTAPMVEIVIQRYGYLPGTAFWADAWQSMIDVALKPEPEARLIEAAPRSDQGRI